MSFDAAKVDQIIQYSLLCAGEEDNFFDRRFSPIHMIKYVYLADLAYAERRRRRNLHGNPLDVLSVRTVGAGGQCPPGTRALLIHAIAKCSKVLLRTATIGFDGGSGMKVC